MSADAEAVRPDRILYLRRGDLRLAMPLLDTLEETGQPYDPTPLGILVNALPWMLNAIDNAPPRADVGAPLDDDASVLMLRIVGEPDPLVPDVGLLAQTEGKWKAGDGAEGARTEASARVPELDLELVDVARPVIALRGADLDLDVKQDRPAGDAILEDRGRALDAGVGSYDAALPPSTVRVEDLPPPPTEPPDLPPAA